MIEKNNIDRLFQEKFKDLDVAPPERLWQNIEAELKEKKKKRRVIPLWFRVGGVAAILVIGLMLTLPLFGDFDTNSAPVVVGDGASEVKGNIEPADFTVKPNTTVTDAGQPALQNDSANTSTAVAGNDETAPGGAGNNTGITNPETSSATNKSGIRHNPNAVAYDNAKAGNTAADGNSNNTNRKRNGAVIATGSGQSNSAVAHQGDKPSRTTDRHTTAGSTKGIVGDTATGKLTNGNTAVANNNSAATGINQQSGTTQSAANGSTERASQQQNAIGVANIDRNGKNNATGNEGSVIKTTAAETAIAEAKVDTTIAKPENELEKLLQEKIKGKDKEEEKAIAEAGKNKWNIKPQLAPVFFNSISQGSPIDGQFAGNSKDYNNDLSLGLGINYALNNKFTLRTGINTVNLSYATNNVQFYAALNEQMPNIAARGNANIVVKTNTGPAITNLDGLPTPTVDGSLVQKMGYIEVPLEMSYKLVDRKFGIDVIGGVSTLFLNENNVHVRTLQGYTSNIGEAQNLNDVHFSTNVGLGFKYSFWKSFQANFEPMFKYQVNAFSGNSGNFRPYFIGLYSGISFSF